jgi:hypothetical protein
MAGDDQTTSLKMTAIFRDAWAFSGKVSSETWWARLSEHAATFGGSVDVRGLLVVVAAPATMMRERGRSHARERERKKERETKG